jgi:glycosyltransferase involved in cell wall biosynthesis
VSRVSVALPVRNGAPHLREAIRSILDQTHADLELVVSDNHSTDGTAEIVGSFDDPRVRLVRPPAPLSMALSHSFAVERTQTEYVAIMGADDVASPQRLARQVARLERGPDLVLVGCWCAMLDAGGRRVGALRYPSHPEDVARTAISANPVVLPTMLLRRQGYEAAGGFRDDSGYAFDYDLVLRLLRIGQVANVPEELVSYRYAGTSISAARAMQRDGLRVRWRALRRDGYPLSRYIWLAKPLAALALPAPLLRAIVIPYMRFFHGRASADRPR